MDLTEEQRAAASRNFTLDLLLTDQLAIRFNRSREAAIRKFLKRINSETKVPDVYEYCQLMLKMNGRDLQKMVERIFYGIMQRKHQMTLDHHNTLHDVNISPINPMVEAPNAQKEIFPTKRKFSIPRRK